MIKNGYPIGFDKETWDDWKEIFSKRDESPYKEYWEKSPAEVKAAVSDDISYIDDPINYFSWGASDTSFASPFGGIDNIRANFGRRMLAYAMCSHMLTEEQQSEVEQGLDRVIEYLVFERDIKNSLSDSDLILSSMSVIALYWGLIKDKNPDRADDILGGNTGGLDPDASGTYRSATYRIFKELMDGSDAEAIFWPEGVQYSTGTRPSVMKVFRVLKEVMDFNYFPEAIKADEALAYGHLQYLVNTFTEVFMFGDAGGGKEYSNFNYNKLPEIADDYGVTGDLIFRYVFDKMDKLGDRPYLNRYTGFSLYAIPDWETISDREFFNAAPRSAWDKNKSVSIWRTGWMKNDTCVLSMLGSHNGAEHWPYYDTIQVWRKGQWVLDDHRGYCGANVFNHGWTSTFYPWGGRKTKRAVTIGYEQTDEYVYHEGAMYGPHDNVKWFAGESIHEHSRAMFFKRNKNGTDTMIVFDRIDVNDEHPEDSVDEKGVPLNFKDYGRLISYYANPAKDADFRHEFNWLLMVDNLSDLTINGNQYAWGDIQITEMNILFDGYQVKGPYALKGLNKVDKKGSMYPNFIYDMNSNAKYRYSNLRIALNQRSGFQTALHAFTFKDKDEQSPTYKRYEDGTFVGVKVTAGEEKYTVLFSKVQGPRDDDLIKEKRLVDSDVPEVDERVICPHLKSGFVDVDFNYNPDPTPEPEPDPIPEPDPEPEPEPEPSVDLTEINQKLDDIKLVVDQIKIKQDSIYK